MNRILCCALVVSALVGSTAHATDPTFLATDDRTLYRMHGPTVEQFTLPDVVRGAAFDPKTGFVMGFGDDGVRGPIFRIENAETGTPSLTRLGTLSRFYGSVTKLGDAYIGTSQGDLYAIDISDPSSPVETFIGTHDIFNTGGLAYDSVHDLLYMTSSSTDSLYLIDRHTAATTLVGAFGVDSLWMGMEAWEGRLYAAMHNADSGRFEIGELARTTGAYTPIMDFADVHSPAAVALAIIPEPSTASLLAAAIVGLSRLRRRC